jgi:hypothetical protein
MGVGLFTNFGREKEGERVGGYLLVETNLTLK